MGGRYERCTMVVGGIVRYGLLAFLGWRWGRKPVQRHPAAESLGPPEIPGGDRIPVVVSRHVPPGTLLAVSITSRPDHQPGSLIDLPGTSTLTRGPVMSTFTIGTIHVPCPFCGTSHAITPPPHGMPCKGCNLYVCAVEWRASFLATVGRHPVPPIREDV